MLEMLRRGASSKLAALVLFVPLIGAFALWGVGPQSFGNGSRPYVAKVGDVPVYPEDYDTAFRREIEQLSRRANRPITPEMAHYYGIDQQVLSRLVGTAALDQEVKKLGLSVSTKSVIAEVRADPAFKDAAGTFSKARFDDVLRQAGMNEAGYVATRKRDDVREQLTDSLLAGVAPPQAYIATLHAYRGETRVVEHFTLDPAKVVKLAEPDEAKLKAFYEGNKSQFVTPERRKIGVLLLTRAAVKAKIDIPEADIAAAYEKDKQRYDIPETRHILQMSFPDRAAADRALPELAKAKDFTAAAVKLGAKAEDIDLGMLSKAKLIDPKIADAVFALKKDEVSKVIEGTFTTVILKVTDIVPGQVKTLADVAAQVKDELQSQRAATDMQAVGNQVEDARSAGKPLAEIAKNLGLEYKEVAAITNTGLGPDGKPAFDAADLKAITDAAFSGAIGLDPDPVDLADGGGAWVTVLGVTPSAQRPFDEVKADVKTAWSEAEQRRELGRIAAQYVERIIKGESMAALATEAGGKLDVTGAISRNTVPPGLTANAVQQAFTLTKDAASSAVTSDNKSRVVFKVTLINVPEPPSPAQTEKLKGELAQSMQSDVLNAFVEGLQKRVGVTINQAVLSRTLGGGQPARP